MNETMMTPEGKKWVEKDYATKGTAGTALGIGIGALALTVLGRNGLGNILNLGQSPNPEESFFGLYKTMRDADDEIRAKQNKDAFDLYKYSRDSYDMLKSQIDALNTKVAVGEAVQPWKDKAVFDAIALEAERRKSADCGIVQYANCTFIPQYIADITPAATSAQKATYNPLFCFNSCGCN